MGSVSSKLIEKYLSSPVPTLLLTLLLLLTVSDAVVIGDSDILEVVAASYMCPLQLCSGIVVVGP